ncbi:MAG: LemA family protein [Pyrinomonadaceae bacterium]
MKRAILLSMVLFAAFGLSGCSYNDLTAKQQQIKGKWANVESAMQRRADLVPNLVDVAKMTAVQEQYPALRSSEAFMKVQDELSGTENRLNTARIDFNDAVTAYNTTRNSFPAVLTAGLLGFKEEPFFKAEEGAKTAPKVGDPNSLRKPDAPVAPVAPATK